MTVTPPVESARRGTSLKVGATLWIVSAAVYFVFEAIAATAVTPAYSYARDYISLLGAPGRSPHADVMNAAFITQAVLFPAGAALLVAGVGTRARVFLAFAASNSIGNLLVATVHSGPAGSGGSSWHAAGAGLAIVGGNAAVLAGSAALGRSGGALWHRAASVGIGVLGLLCLAGLLIDTSHAALPVGVWERGSVYSIYVWQLVTAVYLIRRGAPVRVG